MPIKKNYEVNNKRRKKRLKQFKKAALSKGNSSVQKDLLKIYQNKDGVVPDISRLEKKKKNRWKIFLITFTIILAILAGISWLGFIVFGPMMKFSGESIELELSGPKNIASGDEVTYILSYRNKERVALKNVEVIFRYPRGFEFISAEPASANEFNTVWQLGTLTRGKEGKIEIKGKLIGEVGSIQTINVTASFIPENFESIFKETTSFSSQITSSILEINLEGPKQTLSEKKVTYKITYRNTSDEDLKDVQIVALYPAGFIFQKASPEPFTKGQVARDINNIWFFDTLEGQEDGEITIEGGYTSDEQDQVDFTVQIGFIDEENEFSLQQEEVIATKIIGQNLSLNLIVNGSDQNQPINFGQILTYSIIYKNLGQSELTDVKITATLDSEVLNWEELDDKHSGIVEGNTISWGKDQISELSLLRPLDEGTINFIIKVKEAEDIDVEKTNLQTKSKATATVAKIDELESDIIVEGNTITNNINTDIQLKVEGRYFNDDNIPVGSGPLPPVVDQTTTFRIYWYIANSLHRVSDVEVTTTLPDGIEWADKFYLKTGELNYSVKDNTVTWSISEIDPNKSFTDVNCWFDISVTPAKQQVRKLLILTDQTTLTATDEVTDSEITKIGKAITSNLEDDPIGGGRGLVIDIQ